MKESFRPLPPEAEALPALKILFVAAAALAVFAVASFGAWWMSRRWARDSKVPAPIGRTEIDGVEQQPFSMKMEGPQRLAEDRARLSTYGWADRKRGWVHVPIDVAIQKSVQLQGRGEGR